MAKEEWLKKVSGMDQLSKGLAVLSSRIWISTMGLSKTTS
jgi:hypothetical protein